MVPKTCFLTKGRGIHKEKLTSFEMALRDAEYRAFKYWFVFLPFFLRNARLFRASEGKKFLRDGQVTFAVHVG